MQENLKKKSSVSNVKFCWEFYGDTEIVIKVKTFFENENFWTYNFKKLSLQKGTIFFIFYKSGRERVQQVFEAGMVYFEEKYFLRKCKFRVL